MAYYSRKEYWDQRYTAETKAYDWYQGYHGIRHLLTPWYLQVRDGINPAKPRRILDHNSSVVNKTNQRQQVSIQNPAYLQSRDHAPSLLPNPANQAIPPKSLARVLILGCGNSCLAEDMIEDGWRGGIVNVDFSSVVIEQMQRKYHDAMLTPANSIEKGGQEQCHHWQMADHHSQHTASFAHPAAAETKVGKVNGIHVSKPTTTQEGIVPHPLMEFHCGDVTTGLSFLRDGSFDLIICKATLDAILQSACPKADGRRTMEECHRLLRSSSSCLIVVTHGNPESRIVYFENEGNEWWDGIGIHQLIKPSHLMSPDGPRCHYAYICKKRGGTRNTTDVAEKGIGNA